MASETISIVSFSGRDNGNCRAIADFIATRNRQGRVNYICAKDLNIHPCSDCDYQCMAGACVYSDDEETFLQKARRAKKIIWLVPMYCGYPSSLYFKINERSQRFWMNHDDDYYMSFLNKLYVIAIGNVTKDTPFQAIFEQPYKGTVLEPVAEQHVLVIEAMKHGLNSLHHTLIHEEGVQAMVEDFLER